MRRSLHAVFEISLRFASLSKNASWPLSKAKLFYQPAMKGAPWWSAEPHPRLVQLGYATRLDHVSSKEVPVQAPIVAQARLQSWEQNECVYCRVKTVLILLVSDSLFSSLRATRLQACNKSASLRVCYFSQGLQASKKQDAFPVFRLCVICFLSRF